MYEPTFVRFLYFILMLLTKSVVAVNVALQYLIFFRHNITVIFIDLPVAKFN